MTTKYIIFLFYFRPKPLVLVPCLSWSTAAAVFTEVCVYRGNSFTFHAGNIYWNDSLCVSTKYLKVFSALKLTEIFKI